MLLLLDSCYYTYILEIMLNDIKAIRFKRSNWRFVLIGVFIIQTWTKFKLKNWQIYMYI